MISIARADAYAQSRFNFHADENLCAVVVEGPDTDLLYAVAAAIRRTAIDETPYPALSPAAKAKFAVNTTIFNNEFIWLRMGLVPLSMRTGQVERRSRGTHREEFEWLRGAPEFTLDAQGRDRDIVVVRSDALVRAERGADTELSIEPDPVTGGFSPLVKLQPREQLGVTIRAMAATAASTRAHARRNRLLRGSAAVRRRRRPHHGSRADGVRVQQREGPQRGAARDDTLYWARRRLLDLVCKLGAEGDCGDALAVTINRRMRPHAVVVTQSRDRDARHGGHERPPRK